jgi:transcriptional regulator with XRE-family HTH domain
VRGLDAGACDYIAKPYRTRELLARVRSRLSPQPIAQPVPASPAPALAQPEADAAPPVALDDEPPGEPELPPVTPPDPPPAAPRPAWVTTTKPLMGQEPRRKRPKPEEESVFISEAEELALMREPMAAVQPLAAPRAAIDEPPRTIGQRLRNERLRRQLTLVQIENEIRVRISYLQAMEDDKFTLIPRGPSSQQMLKAYAEYLGVDSAAVLDEFRKTHYVDLIDPLPALGGTPLQRNLPRWLLGLIAVLLALAIAAGVIAYLDPLFFSTLGERVAALWAWIAQYLPG